MARLYTLPVKSEKQKTNCKQTQVEDTAAVGAVKYFDASHGVTIF